MGAVEKAEGIEMIRFLENSWTVNMVEVQDEGLSVDTQRDLKSGELFRWHRIKKDHLQQKLKKAIYNQKKSFIFEHNSRRLQETKIRFIK